MNIKVLTILIINLMAALPVPASWATPKSYSDDLQMARCFILKNQLRNSLPYLNRVIENDPRSAEAHCLRGSAHFGLEELDPAIVDLDMAIKLNPLLAEAHFQRARVYGEQGNLKMALNESNRAITLAGKNSQWSWFQDRATWFTQGGNNAQAIAEYSKTISANPSGAWAYYFRANLYFKGGLYDKAISDLNIACSNHKDSSLGRFCELRAKCFDKLGKHNLAEKDRKTSHAEALKQFDDFQMGPSPK